MNVEGQVLSRSDDVSPERFRRVQIAAHKSLCKEDFTYWVQKAGLSLDGQPFCFEPYHAYLREPYETMTDPKTRSMVEEKAAQMGLTVAKVLFSLWGMKNGRFPKGVLYMLPTIEHAERVSKTKIQPIIDKNPDIQAWVTKTDSVTHKRVGQSNFVMAGMNANRAEQLGPVGLKSFSVDCLVGDEIEHMEEWSYLDKAEQRMAHSEVTWEGIPIKGGVTYILSVPSIPEYGIDAFFAGKTAGDGTWIIDPSDQRYWLIRCQHCNADNCLEDEFPGCIVETSAKKQEAIRVCKKCRRELDVSIGQWVPKKPDQAVVGFHYSQLFSYYVNPWKLLNQFNKKRDLATLFNDCLGLPYVESDARLEESEVLGLCGSDPQLESFPGPCAMGVDQPKEEGGKFHVTLSYKMDGRPCNVVRVCIRNKWVELADLIKQYNVVRCVVDALPDQGKARQFAADHAGVVFMCFYADKQKGAYRWNDDNFTVSVDRTESLNSSTRAIHEKEVHLPRKDDEIILWAKHCHNMARKAITDQDTGSVRHTWVRTGADHFRHSYNYCLIALSEIAEYVKPKEHADWMNHRTSSATSWKTV